MSGTIFLVFIEVAIIVVGQITFKIGIARMGGIKSLFSISDLVKIIINPFMLLVLFLYGLGFFLWAYILSRVQLSAVYPIMALAYALVPLASLFIFHEPISALRWMGIAVVCIGVSLILKG
ncbi:MAG: EamA family transporter [Candidatus Poribacteria bacterium]